MSEEHVCRRHSRAQGFWAATTAASRAKPVGRIFVEFGETAAAAKALEGLNGRSFDGRTVAVVFYPAALFARQNFSGEELEGDDEVAQAVADDAAPAEAVDAESVPPEPAPAAPAAVEDVD